MSAEVLIGVVSALAGGLAVYFARTQANTEREAALHAAFLAISEAFLAYPSLRVVFYEDETCEGDVTSPIDTDTRLRANALAELMMDTFEIALNARSGERAYGEYIRTAFSRSAFLTEWARRNSSFYAEWLTRMLPEPIATARSSVTIEVAANASDTARRSD